MPAATYVELEQRCDTPELHPGHFWRPPEPFTVAWCDGGQHAPMPCGRIQPGTWAFPCVVTDPDHVEHRHDERSYSGTYTYWIDQPGGFAIYGAPKHDGWREGAPRDPQFDDHRQQAVRRAEKERVARAERRAAGLRLAHRLSDAAAIFAYPTDDGGITLAPADAEALLTKLEEPTRD